MSPRATPLPADERRAQIIRVATPLVLQYGGRVTTRQIADAAGLAEGTLFRIFATKQSLIHEVIVATIDPTELCDEIAGIDLTLGLEERLGAVVEVLARHTDRISAMMLATQEHLQSCPDGESTDGPHRLDTAFQERSQRLQAAIEAVLVGDEAILRTTPRRTATFLRAMVFVAHHPMMGLGDLSPTEMTSLLLDGLRTSEPDEES
ncbi:MAG TPA: TetR/AcrR family transcriptional regulator [Candidatus Avipropionibacterium avicola]|uniref:TetR/AcrR family transcriptional regulator n=1 Tax=Candidatus Avipropionibacterium avicola TaxID=2840701 RepID=A0A9D1GXJ9_9ACTN|nr:TetR/AcrR family transcriptional regulator [Candidatus Avipropionibacterium avicola]